MCDAARRLAGKIRRIKPEGAAPVLRSHMTIGTQICSDGAMKYRGAVRVEAAFAEALAVVGDVDEARVDVRSGLEPFHEARQHAVGVAHGVVVEALMMLSFVQAPRSASVHSGVQTLACAGESSW